MKGGAPSGAAGRVLVLGEESRIILPIIRSLGRRRVEVHLGWCPPQELALRSRYLAEVHELGTFEDAIRSPDRLVALLSGTQFDLVVPATEPAVLALETNRARLEQLAPVPWLSERALAVAFDKAESGALAEAVGVPVPAGSLLDTEREIGDVAGLSFPVIVKPVRSVDVGGEHYKRFVESADDLGQLRRLVASMTHDGGRVLVQEHVPGHGVGVEVLADRGEILVAFSHRRLHETSGFGSTLRESAPLRPELLSAAAAMTAALDHTGVAMFEFRVDPDSGRWVFLEVNMRFWGSLPLSVASGVDFPWYLHELLVAGRRSFRRGYETGVRSRDLLNDVRWVWRSVRRTRPGVGDGWRINPVGNVRVVRDSLRALFDHSDMWAWDDLGPGLAEFGQLLRSVPSALTKT